MDSEWKETERECLVADLKGSRIERGTEGVEACADEAAPLPPRFDGPVKDAAGRFTEEYLGWFLEQGFAAAERANPNLFRDLETKKEETK